MIELVRLDGNGREISEDGPTKGWTNGNVKLQVRLKEEFSYPNEVEQMDRKWPRRNSKSKSGFYE